MCLHVWHRWAERASSVMPLPFSDMLLLIIIYMDVNTVLVNLYMHGLEEYHNQRGHALTVCISYKFHNYDTILILLTQIKYVEQSPLLSPTIATSLTIATPTSSLKITRLAKIPTRKEILQTLLSITGIMVTYQRIRLK